MENDQAAPENPDQAGEEQAGDPGQGQPRSYECNFCKKGFSSAQALGGHMNIHRKDKAKLKQETTSHQQPKSTSSYSARDRAGTGTAHPPDTRSGEGQSINRPWPCIFPPGGDHAGSRVQVQLPLFAETASHREDQRNRSSNPVAGGEGPRSGPELDLELRLGHEPQDSSEDMATKKFF
ncbi:hypothetical protein NMG60_11014549 [Bertholletia excelsa]